MNYATNLSNSQWQIIGKFLNLKRKRKHNLREVVNGILYIVKAGCQWRMLPADFPRWEIVYYYFSSWRDGGIIEYIHNALVKDSRRREKRNKQPTAAIIDAQSVKSTLVSCESKGYDAGKRVKGVKRHIIVDTTGLLLATAVHSASIQDRVAAPDVISKLKGKWTEVRKIFADGGYMGTLIEKAKQNFGIAIEIVKRNEMGTFKVLPKRWIVERTISWLDTNRRNSKFYERLNCTGVAMIQLSAIRIMLNRL